MKDALTRVLDYFRYHCALLAGPELIPALGDPCLDVIQRETPVGVLKGGSNPLTAPRPLLLPRRYIAVALRTPMLSTVTDHRVPSGLRRTNRC